MKHKRHQCAFSIRHIRRRHGNGVRQALRIDHNMALDPRNLFASVVPFAFRTIAILDALRINDAKRRLLVAPKADAGRANRIFLMPAPAGSIHLPTAAYSICGNTNTPRPISGNRSATSAIGNRFSAHTIPRKIFRIDRFSLASSSFARFPVAHALFQIALDSRRSGILVSCIQFTHLLDEWQKDRKQVLRLISPGYWRHAHPARTALNRSRILFPQNALPTRASGWAE